MLVFNAPINPLSFGNVGFNILREIFNDGLDVCFHPVNGQLDFGAFSITDSRFQEWIKRSLTQRYSALSRDLPTLKLWHVDGSEFKLTDRQFLYTFHETNLPTTTEVDICNLQTRTFFSSEFSRGLFEMMGCENGESVGVGFDRDMIFSEVSSRPKKTRFLLMGKWEKRKHTEKIIVLWSRLFGDDPRYILHCCVHNPFLKPQKMDALIEETFRSAGIKRPSNVFFIPRLNTNREVAKLLHESDIDLGGLSGAEGWNLPSFNMTALGKWSVVLNATAHKDWATHENCIMVEPTGQESADDGVFFRKGNLFNQGNIFTWKEEAVAQAIREAVVLAGEGPNKEGLALQERFSYAKIWRNMRETIFSP